MKRNSRLWEVMLVCENLEAGAHVAQLESFPQAAQKIRPARPQPMKAPEA